MKKYIINIYFLVIATLSFSSCSDWLDVDPVDYNLEDKQYSTELNINNVLNGLYMKMASKALYGNSLTKTNIENLAHYYYRSTETIFQSQFEYFNNLQDYNYDNDQIHNSFSSIWSNSYDVIFSINNFIANVENSTVITPQKRDVLLGEAYALRAFLHLDLFRLFGPIYKDNHTEISLPYNAKSTVDVGGQYELLPANEFKDKVLADIELAEQLLENDPILDNGILNPNDSANVSSLDKFGKYARNKRMNIIATKALHARALAVFDDIDMAADIANDIISTPGIIEPIDGSDSRAIFTWIRPANITAEKEKDYIFKNEVLFSIHHTNLHTDWKDLTQGSSLGQTYALHVKTILGNLMNRNDVSSFEEISDIRIKQWTPANDLAADLYTSMRHNKFGGIDSKNDILNMQPLMRITELYYIILESYINNNRLEEAANLANNILVRRGYKTNELYSQLTESEARDFLLREYYREFYSEGQTFFYLKRIGSEKIFVSTGSSGFEEMKLKNYVVPIPQSEINN